jgi:hypothetical protein
MADQSKKPNAWFPEIYDLQSAQSAANQGTGVCIAIIIVSWIFSVIFSATGNAPNYQLLIAASIVYGLIAWLISKMSRLAAMSGLILYLADRVAIIAQNGGNSGSYVIMAFFILAFVNSIRGTFAYHRIRVDRQAEINQADAVAGYSD